jgi:hypothetical protein
VRRRLDVNHAGACQAGHRHRLRRIAFILTTRSIKYFNFYKNIRILWA